MTLLTASPFADGIAEALSPDTLLYVGLGVLLGTLVGVFPGVTSTMAVALASGFTLTLEPVQGLAVLITIYVAANFGDRVPAILINTPGTPASISTTFDGYPLAKQGKAGLALTTSAMASAVGMLFGIAILAFAAVPLSAFARRFGPPEMFALVVFGLTMMVSVSSGRVVKGIIAGGLGIFLSTIGRDPMTGAERFTFGILPLNSGISFIALIIAFFGVAEVLNQILTYRKVKPPVPVSQVGQWMPGWTLMRRLAKATGIGGVTGSVVGLVPAVGGDISGVIAWDNARKASKEKKKFGKGSLEGVVAGDTASTATLGGSVATTLALGVPGDAVMAVMIGSMMIWGIQPGPGLLASQPDLLASIVTIMLLATALAFALSLARMKGVVRLIELPRPYLWVVIFIFCMVGTYSINNSVFDVLTMLILGVVGLFLLRFGFPAGPAVLGMLLGPIAESNLRRTLLAGGAEGLYTSPIALVLFAISALSLFLPPLRNAVKRRKGAIHL